MLDKSEYNAVDLLKFIFSILVVAIHISPFENLGWGKILNFGIKQYIARVAVPFFFTASGYFLFRKTEYDKFDIELVKRYVMRIFRLYIIWCVIYLPFVLRGYQKNGKSLMHNFLSYVRDFIFIGGSRVHLWYLNGLIVAVALVSLSICKKIDTKEILRISFALYCIGCLDQSWYRLLTPVIRNNKFFSFFEYLFRISFTTTRNGLFFGFIFVGIGMYFAFEHIDYDLKKDSIKLILCIALLGFEVFFVEYFDIVRSHDMYLCLVPAVYYLFKVSLNINLPNNKIYVSLRNTSILIYLTHILVNLIVTKILKIINLELNQSIFFLVILCLSMICSYTAYKVSENENFKWLKILYK